MIDYAKESTTELYNIFYEFDDILEMPYIALEAEAVSETTPATVPATTSSTTTLATVSASNAQKSDNENPTTDNDAKKAQGKPVTPGNLRSSSGFTLKIKEIISKLTEVAKDLLNKLLNKITQMQKSNINQFLQRVAEAKRNGLQEIEIENNKYQPEVIVNSVTIVSGICTKFNSTISTILSKYEQASAGTIEKDELKREIDTVMGKFGKGGLFPYTATMLQLPTTEKEKATAKTINKEFQDKVRGEKSTFKIDLQYANFCESYLRKSVDAARTLSSAARRIKTEVGSLNSTVKSLISRPGSSEELNSQLLTFTTEISNYTSFAATFYLLASNLAYELQTNCKIVLSRAYNISEKSDNNKPKKEAKQNAES